MAKIVDLANKHHYSCRCCNDPEYGGFLYDQTKALLELFGKKNTGTKQHSDILLFHYLSSGHDFDQYEVSDEFAEILVKFFKHKRQEQLDQYAKRQMADGTKLLYRLNDGSLSVNDFDETIKPKDKP